MKRFSVGALPLSALVTVLLATACGSVDEEESVASQDQAVRCPRCDDGNPCTTDLCGGPGGCTHVNNTNPCDDRNACTTGDVCSNGVCTGATYSCDDGNVCTTDSCAAPSDARAFTVSSSRIDVYWQDNSRNEEGFEIYRSQTGLAGTFTLVASTAANATSRADFGLTASTEYCYKVRSFNTMAGAAATSEFSNTACATTSPPPVAPGLQLTSVTTGVELDPDGYQVEVWAYLDNFSFLFVRTVALAPNETVTLTDLNGGTDYQLLFSGAALNCQLTSPNPQTVHLGFPWEPGVEAKFEVTCSPAGQCSGTVPVEQCSNGIDDDCDRLVDTADPDCPTTCIDCMAYECPWGYVCPLDGPACCVSHCGDGVQNGDEGDVDCGGSCEAKCASGQHCWTSWDCASGVCLVGDVCQ